MLLNFGTNVVAFPLSNLLDRSEINPDNERGNRHETSSDLTPTSRSGTQIYTYSGVLQKTKLSV